MPRSRRCHPDIGPPAGVYSEQFGRPPLINPALMCPRARVGKRWVIPADLELNALRLPPGRARLATRPSPTGSPPPRRLYVRFCSSARMVSGAQIGPNCRKSVRRSNRYSAPTFLSSSPPGPASRSGGALGWRRVWEAHLHHAYCASDGTVTDRFAVQLGVNGRDELVAVGRTNAPMFRADGEPALRRPAKAGRSVLSR